MSEDAQPDRPETPPAGWEGILDTGERILWQGRPDGGVTIGPGEIGLAAFGLVFSGFALFWMRMASNAGGIFWMFGLLHFSVGIGLTLHSLFGAAWRRRHTWYTLTDRRAFIATDQPFRGRRLKSYPIGPDTVLDFESGEFDTLRFAYEESGQGGRRPVAFERITDGARVYRLMRQVTQDARPRAEAEEEEADR